MSNRRIGDALNEVVGGDDVSRAEAQAKACVETARQRLVLTRGGLGEIRQSISALLALTGSSENLSSRRIEGLLWELKAMVQALSLLTEQTEVDVGRVVPELRAMAEATTRSTPAPGSPARIVLKIGGPQAADKPVDPIQFWPDMTARSNGIKN